MEENLNTNTKVGFDENTRKNIYDFTYDQLKFEMVALNQKEFRARQIFEWIYKHNVDSFYKMSSISKDFQKVLDSKYYFYKPEIEYVSKSNDGTIKFLIKMNDGQLVETVLMRYDYGNSVCVSSQVGCLMGCAFCASGLLKKIRNLTSGEMVGQFLLVKEYLEKEAQENPSLYRSEDKKLLTHSVVMGTGEPFDNYDNVMNYIKIINCPYGLEIGARHITVSTCGLVPGIKRFKEENLQINLAISLHAPNDEIRNQLMPINRKYPLKDLIDAIVEYNNSSNGRRVTFEYIMIKDLNSTLDHAKQLVKLIKPTFGYVNLIPLNEVKEKDFKRASNNAIYLFRDYLNDNNIKATIRKEFGTDINAACGQLRANYKKTQK